MKKNFLILMFIYFNYFFSSCTKNYELESRDAGRYGYEVWQGHFILQNGVNIPLLFGVEEKEGLRQVHLFSGSELAHWSYWNEIGDNHDSIRFRAGLHSEFKGIRKNNRISGVYLDGVNTKVERARFVVEKMDKQQSPFPQTDKPTNIVPTGTWRLEFDTLKDLSDSNDLLRYNIDRVQTFDLYRNNHTVVGKAYGAGGIQGFDGVMTENGFICSSFHHSEPFLIEAIFIDENTFDVKISSTTTVYKARGKRKNQTTEDAKYTGSVMEGIYLTLKAFFRL